MSIKDKLASSLSRRDEEPNIELAKEISTRGDSTSIEELIEILNGKDKKLQNDAIKVLYEIGERKPTLIQNTTSDFISHLSSKNNRVQWGSMTALYTIVKEAPELIAPHLDEITLAAERGSVISKDNAVKILIELCRSEEHHQQAFAILIDQLHLAPSNQFPMYSELAAQIVKPENKELLIELLSNRLPEIDKASKKKRIEKVLKKLVN